MIQIEPCFDVSVNSFNNNTRLQRMVSRLKQVSVPATIYHFNTNDPRVFTVLNRLGRPVEDQKLYSHFYTMLQMIEDFYYKSSKNYLVILEDDVYIKKDFGYQVNFACQMIDYLKLDILLVGYLIDNDPDAYGYTKIYTTSLCRFYTYPNDLWGTQGFIITKTYAKYLIDKYTVDEVAKLEVCTGDWIYTKQGNRALMYPPIVVEEGEVNTDHYGQVTFHRNCKNFLLNDSYIKI